MAISLTKGSSFNLSKGMPSLHKVMVGLGWEMPTSFPPLDLDASVFMVNANQKIPSDDYFVYYNNLKSADGSVLHTGDNRTGFGSDDDEVILMDLTVVNPAIQEIIIVVSIHEARERRHNFGLLNNAYIRIYDVEGKREIMRYDLDERSPYHTEIEFGRIRRQGTEWHFIATGLGNSSGLQGLINQFA